MKNIYYSRITIISFCIVAFVFIDVRAQSKWAKKKAQKLKEQKEQLALDYLNQGKDLLVKQEFLNAIEMFNKGLEIKYDDSTKKTYFWTVTTPYEGEFYTELGWAYCYLKDFRNARKNFSEARKKRYKSLRLHIGYAETFKYFGEYSHAYMQYVYALQLKPDDPLLRYAQGVTGYYAVLIKIHQKWPKWYIDEIRDEGNTEFDNPIYALSESIRLKPDYGEAYAARALAYLGAGRDTKASLDIKKAIDFMPNNPEVYYISGLVEKEGYNNSKEAISLMNKAMALDPNNPKYLKTINFWKKQDESDEVSSAILKGIAGLVIISAFMQDNNSSGQNNLINESNQVSRMLENQAKRAQHNLDVYDTWSRLSGY